MLAQVDGASQDGPQGFRPMGLQTPTEPWPTPVGALSERSDLRQLQSSSGGPGYDYCDTGHNDICQNCIGKACMSADQRGSDTSICRFPETLAGGTVPEDQLCSTGCPDVEGDQVWEIPLHLQGEKVHKCILGVAGLH